MRAVARLLALAWLLGVVGALGCMPVTHGCHRGGGNAFAAGLLGAVVEGVVEGAVEGLVSEATEGSSAPPADIGYAGANTGGPRVLPVFGTVVSRVDGSPLAGVYLSLYRQGEWLDSTTSRADGAFSFPHLYARGMYAVLFDSAGQTRSALFQLEQTSGEQRLSD